MNLAALGTLDLGCNTGEFSLVAAETGTRVIFAGADHDAVEFLFRQRS